MPTFPHLDSPLRARAASPHTEPRAGLVRSSGSASAAGDAAFVSTPPEPPSRSCRPLLGSTTLRDRPPPSRLLRLAHFLSPTRLRRRPRLALFLALLALALFLLAHRFYVPTANLLTLFYFKLLDRAYTERWGWPLAPRGSLRKEPLLFVRGAETAVIVWETNGDAEQQRWEVTYGEVVQLAGKRRGEVREWRTAGVARTVATNERDEEDPERNVYWAVLDDLRRDTVYEYALLFGHADSRYTSSLRRHSFPWLGGHAAPSPSSEPTTLHIACFADNQFNLRVFHRLLVRLSSFGLTLPSRYFSSPPSFSSLLPRAQRQRPHLLLHGGDAVQNPRNLAQWQTDFWDPLTRLLPFPALGPTTPILLARGNHDWDPSGANTYTGGLERRAALRQDWAAALAGAGQPPVEPGTAQRGTYFAYSPHARMRIVVLDSNLASKQEEWEQERWVLWELGTREWQEASVRAVVVHTAPWIEWWDREAWNEGGESEWSAYVRHRLMPIVAEAGCNLVLSGHSHAYTRGFLPTSLLPSFHNASHASSVPPSALSAARARAWETTPSALASGQVTEPGMLLLTFGGAGGSLDRDRVEEWGFMSRSVSGTHHFGWLAVSFSSSDGREAGAVDELEREVEHAKRAGGVTRVYRSKRRSECAEGRREVRDVVEWRAVDGEGRGVDRVWLVGEGCASRVTSL
ncbi:hypothetical protein JCM10207_002581 [Rhodosporidiobolus poonsookiae]